MRSKSGLDLHGEDNPDGYDSIDLLALLNYNYLRSWPITVKTETGDLDRQSVQVLFNRQYLDELGYINADGYFQYDPAHDYFIIDGLRHIAMGDTMASQAGDTDILFTIILKRDDTPTSEVR
jgi:hypothetical protein